MSKKVNNFSRIGMIMVSANFEDLDLFVSERLELEN